MKLLQKLNLIIAIGVSITGFYHFFIDSIDLSMNIISSFLALMFLLFGIEKVKEKDGDKKLGYAYLIVAVVFFTELLFVYFS
ncbi:hypothetical protein NC661_16730 [Aquibacillus koreensis]|uniref:DUF3953 domain-containing protein n=1 Tax=Aquibacillus koreensis TaxID=279446 RepID=A0A9X4AL36_9BACI|nr:hypothetical protein [Aquibacillus koreensis]MCT2536219.1 hypothetical protein [Aquibacillus koreensis]MDC3422018.1 hypothetical protein [Aquibacillus koreensis]